MHKFVIITDTNCELNKELQKRFELDYVIPGHVVTPDGVDHLSDNDWILYPNKDAFYKELRDKKKVFTSAPPSIEELKVCFEEFLKAGQDIIFLALSSALSGTYNFASVAAKELLETYKDRKIFVFDTLRYSLAISAYVVLASDLRKEGKSFDEVVAALEEKKYSLHQMGPMDDLFFLARKGRVKKAAAFMGTMVGVKPLGDFSREGMTTVLTKAIGIKKAIDYTIEYVKRTIINPEEQIIFIADTDRLKNAEMIRDRLLAEVHPKEIIMVTCGPSSGVNVGPGLAACYYFGKEISEGLVEEQAIMNEIAKK